jgi:hypothetical protein
MDINNSPDKLTQNSGLKRLESFVHDQVIQLMKEQSPPPTTKTTHHHELPTPKNGTGITGLDFINRNEGRQRFLEREPPILRLLHQRQSRIDDGRTQNDSQSFPPKLELLDTNHPVLTYDKNGDLNGFKTRTGVSYTRVGEHQWKNDNDPEQKTENIDFVQDKGTGRIDGINPDRTSKVSYHTDGSITFYDKAKSETHTPSGPVTYYDANTDSNKEIRSHIRPMETSENSTIRKILELQSNIKQLRQKIEQIPTD